MQNKSNKVSKMIARPLFFILCLVGVQSAKAACWDEAANMYGHDPYILKAIAWKESKGYVGAVGSLLRDGNRALGLMQINTIHLPALRKYGITRNDLFDPCTSQKVGAWVLADCLKKKGDIWVAVGCYYGGSASKAYTAMRLYSIDVRKFYENYKRKAGLPADYQPLTTYNSNQLIVKPNLNQQQTSEVVGGAVLEEKQQSFNIIQF